MIYVIKRDGSKVPYTRDRIIKAINGANKESTKQIPEQNVEKIVDNIELKIQAKNEISVEDIQDLVENFLMEYGYFEVAKKYITYRYNHMIRRENKRNLMETYKDIFFTPASDMDDKRENANINTNSPMGIMLKLGTEGAKQFLSNILPEEFEKAHAEGWLHQHDRDFSLITWNCCQIDLLKVFHGGFSTGHGHLREPNSIRSYAALACIVVQANQNDFFGGQSINCWDTAMAEGIRKTFKNSIIEHIALSFVYTWDIKDYDEIVELGLKFVDEFNIKYLGGEETLKGILDLEYKIAKNLKNKLGGYYVFDEDEVPEILDRANRKTVEETHQAMEAAIHNFCSLHSRAGSQTPFSSINFGMDTTPEGRLAIKETLNAINSGLGNHETAIFPISIFVIKDGINYKEGDSNYDLFKYACKVSAKRLYPNFLSQDATFNMQYYVPGNYNTYAASMGCRTRVIANVNGPNETGGRGNFAFVTLNLPKFALEAKRILQSSPKAFTEEDLINKFYEIYDKYIKIAHDYLLYRLQIIADKHAYNFPFSVLQGVWMGSEKLEPTDTVREILKHATYSIGFCGLAECLITLRGQHHGLSEISQKLGLEIIQHLRDKTDEYIEKESMNWSTFSTPAETVAGRLQKINRKEYGLVEGVTDKPYMTNSFHVPVYCKIRAIDKINIEAPYHELCNAGAISYIEMDGDPSQNLEAFETLVKAMHDANMGYYSINHPVDRDPVCGYTGIIKDECPHCHRKDHNKNKHIKVSR